MSIRLAIRGNLVRDCLFTLAILGSLFCATSNAMAYDVIISSGTTTNMVFSVTRTYAPTASGAVLNYGDLQTKLGSGNVTVKTGSSGTEAGNITVENSFTWSANNLTLDAYESVTVGTISGSGVDVSATSSAGLILKTADGGSSGQLSFVNGGHITFANTI
jgi:hypothetical protein